MERLGLLKPGVKAAEAGRDVRYFKATKDVEVLEGTAANMEGTVGGDIQYFSEPEAFEAIWTQGGTNPLPGMTQ